MAPVIPPLGQSGSDSSAMALSRSARAGSIPFVEEEPAPAHHHGETERDQDPLGLVVVFLLTLFRRTKVGLELLVPVVVGTRPIAVPAGSVAPRAIAIAATVLRA